MKIGILGGGGWGTSLGLHLYRKKFDIITWFHSEETLKVIKETRENIFYLPGFIIPNEIELTNYLEEVIENTDIIFIVIPSQYVREVIMKIDKNKIRNKIFLIASKGIEMKTGKRMSEVLEEVLETKNYAILSGPNFSKEVALRIPTSTVVASKDENLCLIFQNLLTNEYFRVYTSRDSIGVEIGGSLKNVLAIASGISDGLGFGVNTKASLITRGIKEMIRVGKKFGANEETFYGLSGLGDLVATSFSNLSRNRWFGEMIGRGIKPKEIISSTRQVIEGVYTAKVIYENNSELDLPIITEVYNILYKNKEPMLSVRNLMTRILKSEEN
ncbi:MAG: NAD(P)-dependent glycerol-3-phosphate dehydrogenase [Caldisericia bacterium]|nr:NAD(P)-dependent glycerol-3-phosphate dehydrogenase [Caldisericia bacterium]